MRILATITLTFGLLAGAWAHAAEFVLRSRCDAHGPVVMLGDVAEIVAPDAAEAERLAAIELFPTPAAGRQHFARAREIQDLLFLRGVNLSQHRFSGSSQVAIRRAETPVKKAASEKSLPAATLRRVKRQIDDAIVGYLNHSASTVEPWSVEFELDDATLRPIAGLEGEIAVAGGQSPWVGKQRFEVTVTRLNEPAARFPVEAQVTLPAAVVVTSRSVARGVVLCAADVELKRDEAAPSDGQIFQSIDDVVGRETTRAMGAGAAIEQDAVRSPLLIRRGDVVTVVAVAGGVRVSTNARARADGGLGELVPVEAMHDRTIYFARVSGLREAEVYAGAVKVRPAETANVTSSKQRTQR